MTRAMGRGGGLGKARLFSPDNTAEQALAYRFMCEQRKPTGHFTVAKDDYVSSVARKKFIITPHVTQSTT
jgi:hypothetical protein